MNYRHIFPGLISNVKRLVNIIQRTKQPVHLLHIGKTGGTALKHVLRQHSADARFDIIIHTHNTKLRDIRRGEYVMFVLRDPISRFISGFFSRQRQGQPRYFSPWSPGEKEAFEYFNSPDKLALAIASQNLKEKDRARKAMKCILHVSSPYSEWFESEDYFMSRLADIYFIGFQERLAEDFALLKMKLGLPAEASLPNDDIAAHRSPGFLNKELSQEATANLRQWYHNDYKFIALCEEIVRQHPRIRQC